MNASGQRLNCTVAPRGPARNAGWSCGTPPNTGSFCQAWQDLCRCWAAPRTAKLGAQRARWKALRPLPSQIQLLGRAPQKTAQAPARSLRGRLDRRPAPCSCSWAAPSFEQLRPSALAEGQAGPPSRPLLWFLDHLQGCVSSSCLCKVLATQRTAVPNLVDLLFELGRSLVPHTTSTTRALNCKLRHVKPCQVLRSALPPDPQATNHLFFACSVLRCLCDRHNAVWFYITLVLTSFGVHTAPCSHGRCFTNALQRLPTPCLLPGAKYYHTSLPRLAKRQCWVFSHPAPDFGLSRRLQAIYWQFWRLQGVTPPLFHLAQFRALLKWTLSFAHSCQSFTTANLLHFAAKHGPLHHLPSRSFVAQQSLWSTVSSGSLDKMFRSSHDLAAATADFFSTTGLHAAAALALCAALLRTLQLCSACHARPCLALCVARTTLLFPSSATALRTTLFSLSPTMGEH